MLDIAPERTSDNFNTVSSHSNFLSEKNALSCTNSLAEAKIDTASTYLPHIQLGGKLEKTSAPVEKESTTIKTPELCAPMDGTTKKALLKDADLYPPVANKDGSTTYTLMQAGITDRPGMANGADYYSRAVSITVPPGEATSLSDCKYIFSPREIISKDEFDNLIRRDKADNSDIDLHAHGVFTSDISADKQALMLELSNGRPSVNLDWTAHPVDRANPVKSLDGYKVDTISAKRGNDNKEFQADIDDTIKEIGADHTTLIGFSHGGFFDTRYLAHRVASDLTPLNTVLLTHPDVPISAPELLVNGKPELLKDAARRSFVIGGKCDVEMKIAVTASGLLHDTPTYENGKTEERLGDDSNLTRSLIESEGAMPISEVDRHELSTEHFMNDAGIKQLLNMSPTASLDLTQSVYDKATNLGRTKGA